MHEDGIVYVGALLAWHSGTGANATTFTVIAHSMEEALGHAIITCRQHYPLAQGYSQHTATVDALTREVIEYIKSHQ